MSKQTALLGMMLAYLTGCTTVTVTQVDPSLYTYGSTAPGGSETAPQGVHFWLPQPYLLVTPAMDGSETFQWLFLQDYSHEYAVDYTSFLASLNVDVQTQNGILKSVGLKADSSALASKFVTDAASYETAKGQTDAARQQQTAQNQLAVSQAQAALIATQEGVAAGDSASVIAAKAALAQAQAKAAMPPIVAPTGGNTPGSPGASPAAAATAGSQAGANGGQTGVQPANGGQNGNANPATSTPTNSTGNNGNAAAGPASVAAPQDNQQSAPAATGTEYVAGPVLFKVVQTQTGVTLVAVQVNKLNSQPDYLTNIWSSGATNLPHQATLSVASSTASQLVVSAKSPLTIDNTKAMTLRTGKDQLSLVDLSPPVTPGKPTVSADGTTITFSWMPALSPGSYGITFFAMDSSMTTPSASYLQMFTVPKP